MKTDKKLTEFFRVSVMRKKIRTLKWNRLRKLRNFKIPTYLGFFLPVGFLMNRGYNFDSRRNLMSVLSLLMNLNYFNFQIFEKKKF